MVSIAVGMGILAVLGSVIFDAKLVDPDGFIGPSYLRLPTVLALGFGIDLIPRTLWVSRFNPKRMPAVFRERLRTHWTRERMTLVNALTGEVLQPSAEHLSLAEAFASFPGALLH